MAKLLRAGESPKDHDPLSLSCRCSMCVLLLEKRVAQETKADLQHEELLLFERDACAAARQPGSSLSAAMEKFGLKVLASRIRVLETQAATFEQAEKNRRQMVQALKDETATHRRDLESVFFSLRKEVLRALVSDTVKKTVLAFVAGKEQELLGDQVRGMFRADRPAGARAVEPECGFATRSVPR